MDYESFINSALYIFSGFCFGIFASRFCLLCTAGIIEAYRKSGFTGILKVWYYLAFIIGACFIFPVWFIGKTTIGGFAYFAVLIYFFNKGYFAYRKNDMGGRNVSKPRGKKANKWR